MDLEMEMGSLEGQRKRAAEGLKAGDLDVVSGNHHNLYARKALYGDPYVHIAQSNNSWRENFLVCGKGVNGLQDLKGKKVVMDDFDGHTGLNVWLYLRQHGLEEGRDVELVENGKKGAERAREVMEGKYDASFIRAVDRLRALKFGAKIIEVPSMAMIEGVTLTTTTTYVQNHEEECRALIMALIDGIHFFKTNKADTLKIVQTALLGVAQDARRRGVELLLREPSGVVGKRALSVHRSDSKRLRPGRQTQSRDQGIQSAGTVGSPLRQGDRRQRLYPQAL